jgi:hypothetical protein
MEIFISWSGARSGAMAEALKGWLPKIINATRPWLSSADIERGARWATDVASRLQSAKIGIICLTPSNLAAEWILFEAGALSKTLQNTFVCPLLIDLEPSDLKGPLAQFQAARATKEDIKRLIGTINSALGADALPSSQVSEVFEVLWPSLETQILSLPAEDAPRPRRDNGELLEEIRSLVWTLVHRPPLPFQFGSVQESPTASAEPRVNPTRARMIRIGLRKLLPEAWKTSLIPRPDTEEYEVRVDYGDGTNAVLVFPSSIGAKQMAELIIVNRDSPRGGASAIER